MTYSAVSHILSSKQTGMQKEPDLRAKGKLAISLFRPETEKAIDPINPVNPV